MTDMMTFSETAHGPVGICELPAGGRMFTNTTLLWWDGRVDNADDLIAVLGIDAHGDRHVRTEPALVLAVYERWGIAGLERVIGDWSLAIADARQQAVILATDYAAVRPLFYTRQPHRVLWSSRLEALVAATGADTLDTTYIGAFLTYGGHPTRTPYVGIAPVPAGTAISMTTMGETARSTWTMPVRDVVRYSDERRYDEQVRALFQQAVAARLRTSTPVIAELSGGLDSSSIVCMASQLIRRGEVSTPSLRTISYLHEGSLDAPFIEEVEQFCRLDGLHLSTERYPLIAEGAVGVGSPQVWAPLHIAVAREAARVGATTFLTGRNGDLAMGNWFDDSLQIAAPLRAGRLGSALRETLAWSKVLRVPAAQLLLRALRASLPVLGTRESLYALDALAPRGNDESSVRKDFIDGVGVQHAHQVLPTEWMQAPPERRRHFLALTMMRAMRTLQPLDPIRGLDYTHPFAHRPLVEFVMSVPPDVLCGPGEPRRLMRRALGDLWPARLRARRSKSLFGAPWIEALRPLAHAMLHTRHWHVAAHGWIDRTRLASQLQRLTRGLDCNETQLRQIILLEYWLRHRASAAVSEGMRKTA